MKWLRLYHDTVTDPKWRLVALDSGQPLSAVLAVWMSMLVNASEAEDRGTLEGWDDRIAGAAIDLRGDAVRCIREAMQGLVLDGDKLTGWDKRQRESSDDAAERKRRSRANKSGKTPPNGSGGGHGLNGADRGGNGPVTEQSRDTEPMSRDIEAMSRAVTDFPLRAQSETKIKKETGGALCVSDASPPHAPAREADTHRAPPVGFSKVVQFVKKGCPEVQPLPEGWVLPDDWRAWAEEAGQSGIDNAARRFFDHWSGKGACKTADGWRKAWQRWIEENIERGYANGQQRHSGRRQKPGNGLVAYALAEVQRNPGFAEGDPDDGGWREFRG